MRSRYPLYVLLGVLVLGLVGITEMMQTQKHPEEHDAKRPPTKSESVRERDLKKLTAPSAHNWQADPKIKVVKSATGLKYQDLGEGKGATVKTGDTAVVDYVGWTSKGRMFDSSLQKDRTPYPVRVGKHQSIKGMEEGVVGMKIGGFRRLIIPPELGYGEIGFLPTIEPNATLVFLVKLVHIEPAKE